MAKRQKDKERSTNDTHRTKDRVTRTPLITNNGVNSGVIQNSLFFVTIIISTYIYLQNALLSNKLRKTNNQDNPSHFICSLEDLLFVIRKCKQ